MVERAQYVTMGVAGEIFATPAEMVQEILEMRLVARLPQAPPSLLGMIDLRGEGIPVLDLSRVLGMPVQDDSAHTRIVVLKLASSQGTTTVGLRTDRVFEVTVLDEDDLEPLPALNVEWAGHALAGIGRRNGHFVSVLDPAQLLLGCGLSGANIAAAQLPSRPAA